MELFSGGKSITLIKLSAHDVMSLNNAHDVVALDIYSLKAPFYFLPTHGVACQVSISIEN